MGSLADAIAALTRPGGLDVLGPVENVWLTALGIALIAPFAAIVAPRFSRWIGLMLVPVAMGLALVATYHAQTTLALGLITVAITAGLLSSWSKSTARENAELGTDGVSRRMPEHQVGGRTLTRAQSRSFDYVAMRSR